MADLLAALALLTFAGVVGLVVMVIALYAASAALEAAHRAKKKDNNEQDKIGSTYSLTGGGFMPRRTPKKYNVTITYCEHTPEEEARISEQVREAIYQAKMIAIKKREEAAAKEAANT